MVAMSSITIPRSGLANFFFPGHTESRRVWRCSPRDNPPKIEFRLLQNASLFQLDQLIQIEILEAVALRQFDELRRNALHFGADDFVDVRLEARGLESLDEVGGDTLHFERDPFVLVGVDSR